MIDTLWFSLALTFFLGILCASVDEFLAAKFRHVREALVGKGMIAAWCSCCDYLRPTADMDWTDSGLYWCGICRHPEKVIEPPKPEMVEDREHTDLRTTLVLLATRTPETKKTRVKL